MIIMNIVISSSVVLIVAIIGISIDNNDNTALNQ